jgi:Tol biopolymer transport system component
MASPFPCLQTPFSETFGQFSPDGKWVAYVSDESRRDEVFVRAFPPTDLKLTVSGKGGGYP